MVLAWPHWLLLTGVSNLSGILAYKLSEHFHFQVPIKGVHPHNNFFNNNSKQTLYGVGGGEDIIGRKAVKLCILLSRFFKLERLGWGHG